MVHGLRLALLGLGLLSAMAVRAGAQPPAAVNPHEEKIQQLRQEILSLRNQIEPLRRQATQLTSQMKAVRAKLVPLDAKLKVDLKKLEALRKK